MAPNWRATVIKCDIEVMLGDAAARGPADLSRLRIPCPTRFRRPHDHEVAQSHADGDFHQSGVLDRPGQSNTFVPLLVSLPCEAVPLATFEQMALTLA